MFGPVDLLGWANNKCVLSVGDTTRQPERVQRIPNILDERHCQHTLICVKKKTLCKWQNLLFIVKIEHAVENNFVRARLRRSSAQDFRRALGGTL